MHGAAVLRGVQKLITDSKEQIDLPQLNEVLEQFFTMRAGVRLLVADYLKQSRGGSSDAVRDVLPQNCSPAKLAQEAARYSSSICIGGFGLAPQVLVEGDVSATVTYIPAVLQYILLEVLKNACRAVVEAHPSSHSSQDMPPVRCSIEDGSDQLTIRIKDNGTGMSKEVSDRMWDFFYSTYSESAWEKSNPQQSRLAGYGVGLPLSRMYARYFGGDMVASSVEGQGTEVCIRINHGEALAKACP
jgi:signal transduction histidine kinase